MENDSKKFKVLVIEDDESTRESIMFKIKKEGFDADFAPDGEIGLEKIKSDGSISIVLLDLRMPKINGFEFLESLKKDPKFYGLPVVIFTNSYEKEFIKRAVELGVNGYLLKSNHNVQDIVDEVKKCLHEGSCTFDKIA